MAQKVRTIKISWENDDSFIMETKLDAGNWEKVIEMDENGHLSSLWNNVEALCKQYFEAEMSIIGSEMKA